MTKLLQRTSNPIIQGDQVIWHYHGNAQPCLMGDFNGWDAQNPLPFQSTGKASWRLCMTFPSDAYMEYALLINGKRKIDPLNKRKVRNGIGDWNNYLCMPEYRDDRDWHEFPWQTVFKRESRVIRDSLRLSNGKRRVNYYIPRTGGDFPLVVVLDGQEYARYGHVVQLIASLMSRDEITPVALALVENIHRNRFMEYACNDGTVSFLAHNVVETARSFIPLLDIDQHPGAYGILGASMGGLMAFYTAMRTPLVFGKVLCQAGAFKMFGDDFSIYEVLDGMSSCPVNIWMNVGRFDFLLEENQRMVEVLQKKGYQVVFKLNNGGHNYTTWRNDLHIGLKKLFPSSGNKR